MGLVGPSRDLYWIQGRGEPPKMAMGTSVYNSPPCHYFKPDIQTTTTFEGVPEGIIPISPSMTCFNVEVDGNKVQLERRQLGIVLAYAFTDYKLVIKSPVRSGYLALEPSNRTLTG